MSVLGFHGGRTGGAAVLFLAGAVLFAGACDLLDPHPGPAAVGLDGGTVVDTEPPSVTRGAAVFASTCARCHGSLAEGTEIWPAPLWGLSDVEEVVRDGRGAMPAFPALSDSQVVSLGWYLAGLGPGQADAPGAALFSLYCAGCHGAEGAGGAFYPSAIQGVTPVQDVVRMGRGEMPAFSAERLTDGQVDSINTYLDGLLDLATLSGSQYYQRRCAGCHGFGAEGTDRGYELRFPVRDYATYVIRNGRPGASFGSPMPRFEARHLSDQQLTEMLDWLDGFPRPTTGRDRFEAYCASCHGPEGRGGAVGVDIQAESGDEQTFLDQVRQGGDAVFSDRTAYMPAYSEADLSDDEIRSIVAYLAGL